jgi:hypothetical protein
MLTGVVFVLALWTLAGLTARAGAPIGLVVFTFVWGLVLPAFGMTQMSLLPGPWHWTIRVVHLLTGLVAMRLGDLLSRSVRLRESVSARSHDPSGGSRQVPRAAG